MDKSEHPFWQATRLAGNSAPNSQMEASLAGSEATQSIEMSTAVQHPGITDVVLS